jgi:hypothetical protein
MEGSWENGKKLSGFRKMLRNSAVAAQLAAT